MIKDAAYFEEYISAKRERIFTIKTSKNFTDTEKNNLIAMYNNDIAQLQRLENAIALRELKKRKAAVYIKLHKYETR